MINYTNKFKKTNLKTFAIITTFFIASSLYTVRATQNNTSKSDILLSSNNSDLSLLNSLSLGKSKQAILVQSSAKTNVKVTYKAYEKNSKNKWILKLSTTGVVGKRGMSANRHEGDMTTPEGIYGFILAFGSAKNPGTKMNYKRTHPSDYWVSTKNANYNTWITYNGNPNRKFGYGNYENLYATSLYKYALALDFNYGKKKVIGKGSAIFLHIAPKSGLGTSGCIGIPKTKLVTTLKWLNVKKNPKIIIGTTSYFNKLKKK